MEPNRSAWKISLHGGHSGEFCEHAEGSLRDILESAVQVGYHVFGVAEHMPRVEERFLYGKEPAMGWTAQTLEQIFDRYAHTIRALSEEFADRLTVMCGFEIEVIPQDRYQQLITHYRNHYGFDYIVGSVHYLNDTLIDGSSDETFLELAEQLGGLECLAVAYYQKVAEMAQAVRPEVIGHLDLVRLRTHRLGMTEAIETPRVRQAVEQTLEVIRSVDAFVEVNTAGWRKGLPEPYPASWIVQLGARMGVKFCIGDDSHRPSQVGFGLEEARAHLLSNGVKEVHFLTRQEGAVVKTRASLE